MLSSRLKNLRTRRSLTQERLAVLAKVTTATVVKLESGANVNPTLNTLRNIARALGVPLHRMID